jgi:hypothetical protein
MLVLRPAQALRGNVAVQIRGTLRTENEQRVRAPDIGVLDIPYLRRYLCLPTRLDRQQIAWETGGLQSASLPDDYRPPEDLTTGYTVFQVVGPRLEAVVTDVDRVLGAPQVHLADNYAAWCHDDTCFGVSVFDLEPARLSTVEVAVPATLELVQVRVAGVPVTARPRDNGHWTVALGADQLPQRVEVLFQGTLPSGSAILDGKTFPAPVLIGLPVLQTLWTVRGPTTDGPGLPALKHLAARADQQSRIRLETAETMLDYAPAVVARSTANELDFWRADWERHVAASRQDLQRQGAQPPVPTSSELVNEVDDSAPSEGPRQASDFGELWKLQQTWRGPPTTCSLRGIASQIVIDYPTSSTADYAILSILAAAWLCGAGFCVLLARSAAVNDWLIRSPHVVGVLLGLIWWLWFSPSFLGLIVISISVLGALRPSWRAR